MAIRAGVIGLGAMGIWHADTLRRLPGYRLHSICDVTPAQRRLAEKSYDVVAYAARRDFLADPELDLAVVATPSHAHVEPVVAALKAGKHVLCEKPLAQTEVQARKMFRAAEQARRVLMTFQNRRFDADYQTAQRVVSSGRLGEVRDIRLIRWWWSDLMQTFGTRGYELGWRTKASFGGGTLLDFGAHYFDQLLQLLPGRIESVFGDARSRRWSTDVEDQFLAVLRTEGGVVAQVEFALAAHAPIAVEWAVNGSKAGFRYEADGSAVYTHDRRGRQTTRNVRNAREDWEAVYRNLRAVLAGKAEPVIRSEETLRLMRVLDAVRRSVRSGRVVKFRDDFAPESRATSARKGKRK